MVLSLVAVFMLGSSLALLGCGGGGDEENTTEVKDSGIATSALGGKSFTFSDGTAFGVPANTPTTLSFNSNASRFALTAAPGGTSRRATGAVTYGSCTFNTGSSTNPDAPVSATNPNGGGSDFPAGQGPQPNQSFTANPCTFNNDNATLTITIGGITATSNASGTSTGTGGFGG